MISVECVYIYTYCQFVYQICHITLYLRKAIFDYCKREAEYGRVMAQFMLECFITYYKKLAQGLFWTRLNQTCRYEIELIGSAISIGFELRSLVPVGKHQLSQSQEMCQRERDIKFLKNVSSFLFCLSVCKEGYCSVFLRFYCFHSVLFRFPFSFSFFR